MATTDALAHAGEWRISAATIEDLVAIEERLVSGGMYIGRARDGLLGLYLYASGDCGGAGREKRYGGGDCGGSYGPCYEAGERQVLEVVAANSGHAAKPGDDSGYPLGVTPLYGWEWSEVERPQSDSAALRLQARDADDGDA